MGSSWRDLSPQAKVQLLETLKRRLEATSLDHIVPLDGPQRQAFESEADELLYGGAAGSGKSFLLLLVAGKQGRRSLAVRETYPELRDSLIADGLELFAGMARYIKSEHKFLFHDGRSFTLRHLDDDKAVSKVKSSQYDTVLVDELTTLSEFRYLYLLSRMRTKKGHGRCRAVSATNPDGEGHGWVKRRWAAWLQKDHPHPAAPGELRWYIRNVDGLDQEVPEGTPGAMSRTFIPGRFTDNPYVAEEYGRVLAQLPEPYRSQLRDGDWDAGEDSGSNSIIPRSWIRAAMRRWKPIEVPIDDAVGVDVARGGEDRCAFAYRRGSYLRKLMTVPGRETPSGREVVGFAVSEARGDPEYLVDVVSAGASPVDYFRDALLNVYPYNGSVSTDKRDRSNTLEMANTRTAAYWHMRELLDPDFGTDIALPPDDELEDELASVTFRVEKRKIVALPKELVIKMLGHSPDKGDAVVQAYWHYVPTDVKKPKARGATVLSG